jgi:hypothetical protein
MPSFAGARRRSFPEPLVILVAVDVEQDSFILYFKLCYVLGVVAEDGTAAYVPFERHYLDKDRAVEQDRVAADSFVRRDDDLRLRTAIVIGELVEGFRANEWLVRQDDEGGVYLRIQCGEPGAQGTRHSLLVVGVDDDLESAKQGGRELEADGFRGGAENHDYLIRHGGAAHVFDGLAQHSALAQPEQLFCFPHTRGLARGQDDGTHLRTEM